MGVEGGLAGGRDGGVVVAQRLFHLRQEPFPELVVRVEHLRYGPPPGPAGEGLALFGGGGAAGFLHLGQHAEGLQVGFDSADLAGRGPVVGG